MAGKGSRFASAGYTTPKPLIPVAGKPMVKWAIESVIRATDAKENDFIFILHKDHIDQYDIKNKMMEIIPDATFVLDDKTDGAASAVYRSKDYVDAEEELFITDSDQYFVLNNFKNSRNKALENDHAGIIATFQADSPAYSYAELDENGYVKRTAEKEVISDHAAIGAYYFTKSKYFMESIEFMMENKLLTRGEYYVCPVYNEVIKRGKVTIIDADFWMTMGTPEEKKKFEESIKKNG